MEALEQELNDKEALWGEEKKRLEVRLEELSLSKQRVLLEVEERSRKDRTSHETKSRQRGLQGMKKWLKRWKQEAISDRLGVWRERVAMGVAIRACSDPMRHASAVMGELGHLLHDKDDKGVDQGPVTHDALQRLEQALHILNRELAGDPDNSILLSQRGQLEAQIGSQRLMVELSASKAEAKDAKDMLQAAQTRFEQELETLRREQEEDLSTVRAERREAVGRQAEAEADLRRIENELEKRTDLQLRAEKEKSIAMKEASFASTEGKSSLAKADALESQLRRAVEAAELTGIQGAANERQCVALRDALDRQGLDQNASAAVILRHNQSLLECLQGLGWKAISILDAVEAIDPSEERPSIDTGGLHRALGSHSSFHVRSIPDGEGAEGQRAEAALRHLETWVGSLGEALRSEREGHRLEVQELERRLRVLSITNRGTAGERYNRLTPPRQGSSRWSSPLTSSRSPPRHDRREGGREGEGDSKVFLRSNSYYDERYQGRGEGPYQSVRLEQGDTGRNFENLDANSLDGRVVDRSPRREVDRIAHPPGSAAVAGGSLAERVRALEDAARRAAVVARG